MRDRLQAVGCLKEIINQIGERSPSDVEEFYGEECHLSTVCMANTYSSSVEVKINSKPYRTQSAC